MGLLPGAPARAFAMGWFNHTGTQLLCSPGMVRILELYYSPMDDIYNFTMGLSTEEFFTDVAPGSSFTSASIYIADGETMEDATLQMRRYYRKRLSLLNDSEIADVPLEYNGWWPYEIGLLMRIFIWKMLK